jgi:ribulose-5-phosphate 4-epimerase/fuculose-1-phosphate aldolase
VGGTDSPNFRPTSELVSHLLKHEVLPGALLRTLVLHTHPQS